MEDRLVFLLEQRQARELARRRGGGVAADHAFLGFSFELPGGDQGIVLTVGDPGLVVPGRGDHRLLVEAVVLLFLHHRRFLLDRRREAVGHGNAVVVLAVIEVLQVLLARPLGVTQLAHIHLETVIDAAVEAIRVNPPGGGAEDVEDIVLRRLDFGRRQRASRAGRQVAVDGLDKRYLTLARARLAVGKSAEIAGAGHVGQVTDPGVAAGRAAIDVDDIVDARQRVGGQAVGAPHAGVAAHRNAVGEDAKIERVAVAVTAAMRADADGDGGLGAMIVVLGARFEDALPLGQDARALVQERVAHGLGQRRQAVPFLL